jgi:hypothetical protein
MTERDQDRAGRVYKSYEEYCARYQKIDPLADEAQDVTPSFGKKLAKKVLSVSTRHPESESSAVSNSSSKDS